MVSVSNRADFQEMANSHCKDAYAGVQWMLQQTGMWHLKDPSRLYKAKTYVIWILFVPFYMSMVVEAFTVYNNVTKLSEILLIWIATTPLIGKLVVYAFKEETFYAMLETMDSDIFNSPYDLLEAPLKKTRTTVNALASLYKVSIIFVMLFYGLFPMVDNKPLPIPFSYELGNFRYFMYAYQLIALGSAAWNQCSIDTLGASFMGIAAAQIDSLRGRLSRITVEAEDKTTAGNFDRKVEDILKHCIKHHQNIIGYVDGIDSIFSIGLLTQYICTSIVLCTTGFQMLLIVKPNSSQFILLCFYVVTIFTEHAMYCWFGNEIIHKSLKIGEACYLSDWYKCNTASKKMMMLMMERAKRPMGVTAYKFTFASLESLVAVLRWSYSILAVLNRMYS